MLKDFVGQDALKTNIKLLIDAHKKGRQLPHLGIWGPAGAGKTSLAHIIANEVGAETIYINAAAITSTVVFRAPIANAVKLEGMNKAFLVIIDEAHNLPRKIQDLLLSALEKPSVLCTVAHRNITLPNGKVIPKGDIIKEKLPENMTFVLCSTNKNVLSDPLLTRLHPINLVEYSLSEKVACVKNRLDLELVQCKEPHAIELLAQSVKNMRHLQKVCDRLKDFIVARDVQEFKLSTANDLLSILGIDKNGCEEQDRSYLKYLSNKGTVSLANIARFLSLSDEEVKTKIEPWLIKKDWIEITPRGRKLTTIGSQLFGTTNNSLDTMLDIKI